jgi:hypothetical protein
MVQGYRNEKLTRQIAEGQISTVWSPNLEHDAIARESLFNLGETFVVSLQESLRGRRWSENRTLSPPNAILKLALVRDNSTECLVLGLRKPFPVVPYNIVNGNFAVPGVFGVR